MLKFNTTCLIFLVFFVVGTFWVWRSPAHIKAQKIANKMPVVKSGEEIIIEETDIKDKVEREDTATEIVKPKKKEIPKEINLDVPFTSQAPEYNWDQPWQDACEEAAVLMLDAFYKTYDLSPIFAKDEMQKMIDWETEKGWGYSISVEKVNKLVKQFAGKNFDVVENPTVDQIKQSVAEGHPVLVVAYGKDLPNPNFTNGGPNYHALIVRVYNENSFITNDPGTRNGKNFVYKYGDLMSAIHDWNSGDVEEGRDVVLIQNSVDL